jgi:penicillin-binding protein 1A
MVGGRSYRESPFNRATQARRQPGSTFKPLIFAAALERGWSPGSMLRDVDAPIEGPSGPWIPNGEHEAREYTLRRALKVSSNRAAAQLMQAVGVSSALEMAHRLGIRSDLPAVPSLALGTGEVTLFELTSAYSAFANGGLLATPMLVTKVEENDGTLLWENTPSTRQVLSSATAFLISHILSDVVTSGTGAAARSYGFTLPAAGKTGTTNDFADSWFIGYTPRLVTGVWIGFDRPEKIMNRGFASVIAVPVWARFMKEATKGDAREWLNTPAGVEKVEICSVSRLLATEYCRQAAQTAQVAAPFVIDEQGQLQMLEPPAVFEEYFATGDGPLFPCNVHTEWQSMHGATVLDGASSDLYPPPLPGVVGTTYRATPVVPVDEIEEPPPPRVIEMVPPLAPSSVPPLPEEKPPN